MCSAEDGSGEETVYANYHSGPQLSAKAHYRANYGHSVIYSIFQEEDVSEDHGVTTCTQPCMTDEIMKSDVDPLLVLSQQTEATWEKETYSQNLFQIYHQNRCLKNICPPLQNLIYFLTIKWWNIL